MNDTTLHATADANGVRIFEPIPVKPIIHADWHDELQSYLHDKSIAKLAGMTRTTASSYCG